MSRGRVVTNSSPNAEQLLQFFIKLNNVRASTAACGTLPPPTPYSGTPLVGFSPVGLDEVLCLINSLPNKQCSLDPIPTWLLKKAAPNLAPFLVKLFNKSLSDGVFPQSFKTSYITPILKKPGLDCGDTSSYRPISNLSVISILLERLILVRITKHLDNNKLLPINQSAYRQYHSTETAVLKVFSDVLEAADHGKLTLLVLLDLSSAFDIVDRDILCRQMQSSFGFDGQALNWLRSYLNGRECQIKIGDTTSSRVLSICCVPQGSVLGPTLFSIYTADLSRIIASHGLRSHFYADDTQVYGHCDVNNVAELSTLVSACVDDVYQWMKSSRLQLNSNKSEVIWFTTRRRSHQCPSAPVRLGNDWISPSSSVRDLGVFLDSELTMQAHVGHITRVCFMMLRQIRTVAAQLPSFATKALVTSLVLSKLDYCNSVMVGLPKTLTRRLQFVVNATARLVMRKHKYDHITPILSELHWLGIERRIEFKVALLVFKCIKEMAPPYLASKVTRLRDLPSRKRLRSSSLSLLFVPAGRLKCAGDRSFTVAGPRIWNQFPPQITSAATIEGFRKSLKTHLYGGLEVL